MEEFVTWRDSQRLESGANREFQRSESNQENPSFPRMETQTSLLETSALFLPRDIFIEVILSLVYHCMFWEFGKGQIVHLSIYKFPDHEVSNLTRKMCSNLDNALCDASSTRYGHWVFSFGVRGKYSTGVWIRLPINPYWPEGPTVEDMAGCSS